MFFTGAIKQKDKIDFLEYMSFQLKTKTSFEKATLRYVNGAKRADNVIEGCNIVIDLIQNGNAPAVALYEAGFLDEHEYSLILNSIGSGSLDSGLKLIVELKKNTIKSTDVLKKSVKTGLIVLMGVLSLIPLFQNDIIELYQMFADMATMASDKKGELQLPLLVKHWWMIYVVFGVVAFLYFAVKKILAWVYETHGETYYTVFKYKIYIDLIGILEMLRQMTKTMSMTNAYRVLSNTAPTQYWRDFFNEIDQTLKNGGKASEVFAANGAIPVDVVYSLVDAEDTGEVDGYLKKAIDYCIDKNNSFQDSVRVVVPMLFELFIFFVIGLVIVKFVGDMNNLGIMNVVMQIGK